MFQGEFDPLPQKRMVIEMMPSFFPWESSVSPAGIKHNALLEDIIMFLFWEENTAKNLDKNHQAEEESQKDVGSAGV